MSVETITVGELISQVSDIVASTGKASTNLLPQIRRALHYALREYLNKTHSSCLHADGSLTTVAGVSVYDLAEDFAVLIGQSMRYTSEPKTPLVYMTVQQFEYESARFTEQSGDATVYMLRRRNAVTGCQVVQFWPVPSAAKTIVYRYVAIPANIANASEATILDPRIPAEHHHGLVQGAVTHMSRFVDTPTLQVAVAKWNEFLADATANEQPIVGVPLQRQAYRAGNDFFPNPPTNYGSFPWS